MMTTLLCNYRVFRSLIRIKSSLEILLNTTISCTPGALAVLTYEASTIIIPTLDGDSGALTRKGSSLRL